MSLASGESTPCETPAPADQAAAGAICFQHCYASASTNDHQPARGSLVVSARHELARPGASAPLVESGRRYSRLLLARVTAPPLPLRNCCFRT
jgi:hypothetical protein